MRIQNKKILVSILFILISFLCSAVSQGDIPQPPPPTPPVGDLPIDGFTGIAFVVGAILGIRKLIKNPKQ